MCLRSSAKLQPQLTVHLAMGRRMLTEVDPEICPGKRLMTLETCGIVWWSSFFLTSFNRGRGSGAPWINYCLSYSEMTQKRVKIFKIKLFYNNHICMNLYTVKGSECALDQNSDGISIPD